MNLPKGARIEMLVVDSAGWVMLGEVKIGKLIDSVYGVVQIKDKRRTQRSRTKYRYIVMHELATYEGVEIC